MPLLSVNLAGIGLDSCRRGAPSPQGENFGGTMNGRTRKLTKAPNSNEASLHPAGAKFGGFLGCFGVSGRVGLVLG